jgi:uncharacterized protein with HEPN domain
MKGNDSDKIRIRHIEEAIAEIEQYSKEAGIENFQSNSMLRNAIIGEAASKITPSLKAMNTQIQWRSIIGPRNILTHEYFGIDTTLVKQIVEHDMPELKEQINLIIEKMK